MELINFIAQDASHFWGTILLIVILGNILTNLIYALKK